MQKADPLIRAQLRLPFTRPGLVSRSRLQEQSAQGIAILIVALSALFSGCAGTAAMPDSAPAAVVVRPTNPVRLSPTKRAPLVGFVFGGMRFPVTASAENCEFLRVATPWWGEAWIVGPPEYATIENAGCADLPDQSLGRGPQG